MPELPEPTQAEVLALAQEPEPVRVCAQCELSRGMAVPVDDPRCPHTEQWYWEVAVDG